MKTLLLSKQAQQDLEKGAVVKGMDTTTNKIVSVMLDENNVIREIVKTSTLTPYIRVELYNGNAETLSLTEKETKALKEKRFITVYRSSGYKEGDKVLTREQQIALGKAREINIELVDGKAVIRKDTIGGVSLGDSYELE